MAERAPLRRGFFLPGKQFSWMDSAPALRRALTCFRCEVTRASSGLVPAPALWSPCFVPAGSAESPARTRIRRGVPTGHAPAAPRDRTPPGPRAGRAPRPRVEGRNSARSCCVTWNCHGGPAPVFSFCRHLFARGPHWAAKLAFPAGSTHARSARNFRIWGPVLMRNAPLVFW